ncbi:4-hydroxy-tetrahydrodipicolinate reductase [Clostridium felsineum]|uniref:4-hydroxy-tetrahydrodipicolinate reductase n=1 Tax=Clostridium felsineum TaxID=36839 RepID=UPI00098C1E76|nr:4-hydroxy-tetrahydrodipicolinate reductase [Clostridium felsineum]URZ00096.1 4-hydroxy-tetrahydrodipicolinate reductase [Clostridium felsineum]
MVKILLNGCGGKMGTAITNLSKNYDNISIVAGVDKSPKDSSSYPVFKSISEVNVDCDVILDFSRPDSLDEILNYSNTNSLPIVLCTTGYTKEQIDKINEFSKNHTVFRSANMSIGVNIVNNILKSVSTILYENYDIELIEKHHNQKVDAPSGTALLLADTIKNTISEKIDYIYGREGVSKKKHNEIGIHAIRGGSIVGEHDLIFAGEGETIEIKHTAQSRDVFAAGSLKACAFIYKKAAGLYDMNDVLGM